MFLASACAARSYRPFRSARHGFQLGFGVLGLGFGFALQFPGLFLPGLGGIGTLFLPFGLIHGVHPVGAQLLVLP